MKDLLQQLWDEYKLAIDVIDDLNDEHPFLTDTQEMQELRGKLIEAGVAI